MSKRRRRSSQAVAQTTRASTPNPQPSPVPMLRDLPSAPDQQFVPPLTTTPEIRHRLATSENGSGGSGGNVDVSRDLLGEAAALLDLRPVRSDEPAVLRSAAREYRALTEKAIELENAAAELRDAQEQAAMARRRIQRARRAAERAAQREATREEGGLYANEPRSPNRPVHVEVDPQAWDLVKAEAIRCRRAVADVVGELVNKAVDRPIVGQRDQMPAPSRRFTRLFISDDVWRAFRVTAARSELSAARAVGVVVEIEARELGWHPTAG